MRVRGENHLQRRARGCRLLAGKFLHRADDFADHGSDIDGLVLIVRGLAVGLFVTLVFVGRCFVRLAVGRLWVVQPLVIELFVVIRLLVVRLLSWFGHRLAFTHLGP